MGRSLTTIVRQELDNLDKDAESRRSAMKALKTHAKDLDSKAIPLFMEQVSQSKETGLSGECSISLYEVLARGHGPKIVPQIPSIMASIVKTLSSSAGSFPLQQACSRVVPAIARYSIGPNTTEPKKKSIIRSLADPLADSLSASKESLASGAALCLKALVDAENWRFASDEMVNKLCRVVAVSLEQKPTQTNSHMGLAMGLAKRNPTVVEPYAGLLIRAGIQILNSGLVESNSQKRLSAIQMVNFLMKWLDPWSLVPELSLISEEMEKCQSDQMAFVRGAAFEALQTAKRISFETAAKNKNNNNINNNASKFSPRSPVSVKSCFFSGTASPESRTLDSSSFVDYEESWSESPRSTINSFDRRSANRKLWCFENGSGGVDVSLKDGLFSRIARESSGSDPSSELSKDENCEEFGGFVMKSPRLGISRSTTTSPLRSRGSINVNDIIFNTPRKLVHSLQDSANNSCSEKRTRKIRSLSLSDFEWNPVSECGQNYSPSRGSLYVNNDAEKKSQRRPEYDVSPSHENNAEGRDCTKEIEDQKVESTTQRPKSVVERLGSGIGLKFVFVPLFVILVVFVLMVWMSEMREFEDDYYLVPT